MGKTKDTQDTGRRDDYDGEVEQRITTTFEPPAVPFFLVEY